jgi:hypothetical protein
MEKMEKKPREIEELEKRIKGAVVEEVYGWWGAIPTKLRVRKGDEVIYIESCCACNSGFWHLHIHTEGGQRSQQ